MAGLLEYKCPCCGGVIEFDSASQQMKCPYCDTQFEVEALKGYDDVLKADKPDEMNWETPGNVEWETGETEGMRIYTCKSCGGERRDHGSCKLPLLRQSGCDDRTVRRRSKTGLCDSVQA